MKFIMLIVFACAAFAGIRGVGLGGGHGEMQAFLADQRLPEILRSLGGCSDLLVNDQRPLRPDPTCRAAPEPGTVYISSCDLYEFGADGKITRAKKFEEILPLVFAARSGKSLSESRALFRDLRSSGHATALTPRDAELKIRYLEVDHRGGRFTSLMLEGKSGTIEIADQLEQLFECAQNPSWQIGSFRAHNSGETDFLAEAPVTWTCGAESYRAELRVHVYYTGQALAADDIGLQLIDRHESQKP